MIYLDNAATTMIKPLAVQNAVVRAMQSMASPGRGGHDPAMLAAETVFSCREAAAKLFNAGEAERIVFTMNATHGLNLAIKSLAGQGTKTVVSGFEHNSVTRPLYELGADIRTAGTKLFDPADTLNDFDDKLKGAELAVCTHVSNAFGYILPIYDIARLCRDRNVPLIIDASQSAGVMDVDWMALSPAFIAMPGHKALFGPQGTGILICGEEWKCLLSGGSGSDSVSQTMPDYLPDALEAGTHNVCGIAGLLEGIRYVQARGTDTILAHEQELLADMLSQLQGTDRLELFSDGGKAQSGVLSMRSSRIDCESLGEKLNRRGIYVRSGLHCAPYAHGNAGSLSTGTVRFSFSPFVNEDDIKRASRAVQEILQEVA